jgi:hypothetical protein
MMSQISRMTAVTGTRALATTAIFGPRKNTLKLPKKFRRFAKTRRMFRNFCGLVKRLLGHYAKALKFYLKGGIGYKLSVTHEFESSSEVARCAVQPGNIDDLKKIVSARFLGGFLPN